MPLGGVTVRADWQIIEKREQSERAARRAALQLAVIAYGLIALALVALRSPAGLLQLIQVALFAAAFLFMPLYTTVRGREGDRRTLAVCALGLVLAVVLAFLTSPLTDLPLPGPGGLISPWFSLLIPAGMVGLLRWATRRHPGLSHELGLTRRAAVYHSAIGASLGIVLGFNLWIVASALPGGPRPTLPPAGTLAWLLATGTALTALGEELTLRGALFRMFAAESHGLRPSVFLRIITLGAPLYIAPILLSLQAGAIPMGLLYGTLFGILAIVLRYGFRSITASLAANVMFGVFMALVILAMNGHASIRRRTPPSLRWGFPLAAGVLAGLAMAAFYIAAAVEPRLIPFARLFAFLPVALSSYRRQNWLPGLAYTALFAFTFIWQAGWAAFAGEPGADLPAALTSSFLLLGTSLALHSTAAARGTREALADAARERGELLERTTSLDQVAWFVSQEAMADLGAEDAGLMVRNPVDDRWELYTQETILPAPQAPAGASLRLTDWLATRERETVIDDLWSDRRFEGGDRWRSLLAKPLRDPGGRLLAVLVLTHTYPGMFGPEDITALARLGGAAETALGHASAYERAGWASERLARQLAAIQRTARELNAELEPEAIAGRTLDCAMEITGASAGAILIEMGDLRPLVRSTTGGLGGYSRQSLRETSAATRAGLEEGPVDGLLLPSAGSRLLAPIRRESRPFGAIVLENAEVGAFISQDVQAVTSLTNHAAVALENARLFAQVQAEREKSQQIVLNIADGVLTLNAERRLTSLNPAAERLIGREAGDALGQGLCELLDCGADACPGTCARLERLLAGADGQERGWRRRPNGETGPVLKLSAGPLLQPERGAVVLLHDVTREEELAQFQRELVATFSHELRSPLANIDAVADLLLAGREPEHNSRWREMLELLKQQSRRLAGLAERTLDVARLDDGRWRLEPRPLPAGRTGEDAIDRWRLALPGHHLCLEADPAAGWVWADEVAVNTVLDNLVDNAAKYSPAGTTITVQVQAADGDFVSFAVIDQGQGIAPEERTRVFQRFRRGNATDSQRVYGYGLGLYVSERLVQAMGGRIWVEPGPLGGSQFVFTLPVREGGVT